MTPLENHFTYGFGLFFSYLLILLYNISKIAQILFSLVGPLKILMCNDYALIADKMPHEKTMVLEYE